MANKKEQTLENLRVTFAGAGAGKTTGMIEQIKSSIKTLEDQKFLATITYTNSATNDIKNKLSKEIKIPDNVFIGTIHSFMINFFIEPFLQTSERLLYVEKLNEDYITEILKNSKLDTLQKSGKRTKLRNKMLERCQNKGIISFDKVTQLSKEFSEDKEKIKIIANRLQYIFIDEYQDVSIWQHKMFLNIAKENKTSLFVVGDPNQAIFNFAYKVSQICEKKPKFLPLLELKERISINKFEILNKNYRSTKEIIQFSNKFNHSFQQDISNNEGYKKVKFIKENTISDILEKFRTLKTDFNLSEKTFILAQENNTYKKVKNYCTLPSKGSKLNESVFKDIENKIISISGLNRETFLEKNTIDKHEFRCLAIYIFKKVIGTSITTELIKNAFSEKHDRDMVMDSVEVVNKDTVFNYEKLQNNEEIYFLTIHKSKGLEAESVLVISEKKTRLFKWLNSSKEQMESLESDDHRLGYVAFTRARKLLVLCCLEQLSESEIADIKGFDIKII